MLLEDDLTGRWIQEQRSGMLMMDISCSLVDGRMWGIGIMSSGRQTRMRLVVKGLKVVRSDEDYTIGTYNGLDTIRWFKSGRFCTNWYRQGMQQYISVSRTFLINHFFKNKSTSP